MKILFIIFGIMLSLPGICFTRKDAEKLLLQKNVSLSSLEAKGSQVILGEVTGHGRAVPLSKIEAILTDQEAILKHEIEGVSPTGQRMLSNIESLRASGQYILKEDVKGIILSR